MSLPQHHYDSILATSYINMSTIIIITRQIKRGDRSPNEEGIAIGQIQFRAAAAAPNSITDRHNNGGEGKREGEQDPISEYR